ncbi:MAG: 3-oxoacyl-ACP reductase FabG [Chloroflexi bacterium]|nr:3-oxoacyl-ACP reductase FabG [Chloroflexota bacterium]
MELKNRIAVVTGGGRGIGWAIAQTLAGAGAAVAIWEQDASTEISSARQIAQSGGRAIFVQTDVSKRASVNAALNKTIDQLGAPDILVNNAGLAHIGPSETFPEDEWRQTLDVMLTGVFLCSQAVGTGMLERHQGVIVNIASIGGLAGWPQRLAYNAAKAAVINLTQTLAVEWIDRGVRVNAVSPGVTRTEMVTSAIREGLVQEESYVSRTPMRRLAQPSEIAEAVLFLVSDRSTYITGHNLVVDGGWTAYGFF